MLDGFSSLKMPHLDALAVEMDGHMIVIVSEANGQRDVAALIIANSIDGAQTEGDVLNLPTSYHNQLL
jgi:uridine phosphorylase